LEDRAGVPDLIKLQVDFQRLLDTKQRLHLMKCSVFSGVTAKTKGVSQLDKWRRPQHWPDKSGCIEPTHPPPPHTVHPCIRPHFLAMRQRPPRDSVTGWATSHQLHSTRDPINHIHIDIDIDIHTITIDFIRRPHERTAENTGTSSSP
jgi:hypothetical protein